MSHINAKGEELVEYEPKLVCEGIKVLAFPVEHDIDGAVGFCNQDQERMYQYINIQLKEPLNLNITLKKSQRVLLKRNGQD